MYEESTLHKKLKVCSFAEIRESRITGEKSLHAVMELSPGDILIRFGVMEYLAEPNRFTVQAADKKHIMLDPEYLQYINHSCTPNVFFDLRDMSIICIRPILMNDEITFFYPSTEWSISQDFHCRCGSLACLGHIRGAMYISPEILNKYRLSEFIREMRLNGNNHKQIFRQECVSCK